MPLAIEAAVLPLTSKSVSAFFKIAFLQMLLKIPTFVFIFAVVHAGCAFALRHEVLRIENAPRGQERLALLQ